MQIREKILAVVLGSAVVAWVGLPYLESTFLSPLRKLEADIATLTDDKDRLWKQQLELAGKDAQMKEWRTLSLPPDPEDSQRLYQEWITNLALMSGFNITKITLERRVDDSIASVTIPLTIEARAKLREIVEFLERFESVDLLHRITRCDVVSPSSEGDPELSITLTAEGLALKSAPKRARLFAQTELFEPLKKDATSLIVVSNNGFPGELPFCIRIGTEFLNVTAINENTWTVQRGVERTFADQHESASAVEHFPLRPDEPLKLAAGKVWNGSLFTKPAPLVEYKPKLANSTPPTAIRGRNWTWKLELSDWNPAFGTPKFELLSAPPGVELNERLATLLWRVSSQAEVGNLPIQILIWGTNGRDAGFVANAQLKVRNPNRPPQVTVPGPLRFFIGRESTVKLTASDPDGNGKPLNFTLEQGPTGMTIDSKTGELRWKPGDDSMAQKTEIRVKVTDSDEMPESATATVPVTLEEDSARYTYVTAAIKRSNGDDPSEEEAWIYDRATDRTTVLHVGQKFQVADFDLTLETIGATYLLVRQGDKLYRWRFEQPLTQMIPETDS